MAESGEIIQNGIEVAATTSNVGSWSLGCDITIEDANADIQEIRVDDIVLSGSVSTEVISVDIDSDLDNVMDLDVLISLDGVKPFIVESQVVPYDDILEITDSSPETTAEKRYAASARSAKEIHDYVSEVDYRSQKNEGDVSVLASRVTELENRPVGEGGGDGYWYLDEKDGMVHIDKDIYVHGNAIFEKDAASGGKAAPTGEGGAVYLSELLDVNLNTELAEGEVLTYDNGYWVNKKVELKDYYTKTEINSMWHLDNDGNLITDRNVVINENLIVNKDSASGGQGGVSPASGTVTSVKVGEEIYDDVTAGVLDMTGAFEDLQTKIDLTPYLKSDDAANTYAQKTTVNNLQQQHDILRSEFDALNNILNSDTEGVIDTWNEVVDFLNEYNGSEDLATILSKINGDIQTLQGYFSNGIAKKATADAKGNTIDTFYTPISSHNSLDGRVKPIEDWYNKLKNILFEENGDVKIDTNLIVTKDSASGGNGTATSSVVIKVNGETFAPNDGVITLPDYPDGGLNETELKNYLDRENYATEDYVASAISSYTPLASYNALEARVGTAEGNISSLQSGKADKATKLSGYGITDAYTKEQTDSEISSALAPYGERIKSVEDSVTALGNNKADKAELSTLKGRVDVNEASISTLTTQITNVSNALDGKANKATSLAGYNINDAKIENGVITLGNKTITPLTSHQSIYTLTIQKNGTSVGTFTANSKDATINITDVASAAALNTAEGQIEVVNAQIININTLLDNKANKADSLSGYGIKDAYTRAQTNEAINNSIAPYATRIGALETNVNPLLTWKSTFDGLISLEDGAVRVKGNLIIEGDTASGGAGDPSTNLTGYLNDLLDVSVPTPSANDILRFNGTEWVNTPQSEIVPNLEGYATESWVQNQGYALRTEIPTSLPASDVYAWAKKSSLAVDDIPDLSYNYLPLAGGKTMTGKIITSYDGSFLEDEGGNGIIGVNLPSGEWGGVTSGDAFGTIVRPTTIRSSGDNLYHYNNTSAKAYKIIDEGNIESQTAGKAYALVSSAGATIVSHNTTYDYVNIRGIAIGYGGNTIEMTTNSNLYIQRNITQNTIINQYGGNVGIGVDSPLSKLHIGGQFNLSHKDNKNYAFISQDDYSSNTSWMKLGTCYGYQSEKIALTIYNGMVKIGNSIPTCSLDVSGDSKISGNLVVSGDVASGGSGTSTTAYLPLTGGTIDGALTVTGDVRLLGLTIHHSNEINGFSDSAQTQHGNVHLNYRSTGNVTLAYGGGNVGIGTNSPTLGRKLQINSSTWDGFLALNRTIAGGGASISCYANGSHLGNFGIDGNGHFEVNGNNGTTKFWVTANDGFTSIGYSSHAHYCQLDVNGSVRCTQVINSSDIRYKNKIDDVILSLDVMANAPLFLFTWNNRDDHSIHLGSSAQYWEAHRKEIVMDGGIKSMDYATLGVAMGISLAKKTLNLDERVKVLEAENKALKEQINEMKYGEVC